MSNRLAIALYVQDRPELVPRTLLSILAGLPMDADITVICDGCTLPGNLFPGAYMALDMLQMDQVVGAPVALNTWVANCGADVQHFVFLENGVLLGQESIPMLLRALEADRWVGMAGPSTNISWNQQRIAWYCGGDQDQVHLVADMVRQTYGEDTESLSPLYSLGAFCLAMKRDLLDTIGGAHVGYGLGPCWEMDLHIRAERAGYAGKWVMGAYVWRTAASELQLHRESEAFEHNKRLYQDRLCGLRLRGLKEHYEPHCRGDACAYFAPTEEIPLVEPRPKASRNGYRKVKEAPAALPMVSCIMPTANRPEFVGQAVNYFLRQDYPKKELIIIYDQPTDLPRSLRANRSIRLHQMPSRQSIGNKRNMGLDLSRGEVVALWDDDDWFHASRLRRQLMPILLGLADVCGMQSNTIYSITEGMYWRSSVALFQKMYRCHVLSGSLAFRKSIVDLGVRYPDLSMCEDAMFLERTLAVNARLGWVPARGIYIYVRHETNTWRFKAGQHLQPNDWVSGEDVDGFEADRSFYAKSRKPSMVHIQQRTQPLVSCIMPTANRGQYVGAAIQQFLAQDYPHRELIIIDDGHDPVRHLVPDDPRIRYEYHRLRQSIGAKRNMACELARGELILHWDDDDWVAPNWVTVQVGHLLGKGADITGLTALRFFDPLHRRAWLYEYPASMGPWVAGGTMCYSHDFWLRNRFQAIDIGEDNAFIFNAQSKLLVAHQHVGLYAARVHGGNTSQKQTHGTWWKPIDYGVIERMMEGKEQ